MYDGGEACPKTEHHHVFPSLPRRLLPPAPPASLLRRDVSADPGAQVVGLYEAADDGTNQAGWGGDEDGDVFRIAVVVTGSPFAEETGFDSSVRWLSVSSLPQCTTPSAKCDKNQL